jgi:hypothetical protein
VGGQRLSHLTSFTNQPQSAILNFPNFPMMSKSFKTANLDYQSEDTRLYNPTVPRNGTDMNIKINMNNNNTLNFEAPKAAIKISRQYTNIPFPYVGIKFDKKIHTWKHAAMTGKLELIEYLHNIDDPECRRYIMDLAAKHGHLSIVAFLHHNRTEGCSTDAIDHAAENGHYQVVKFLLENRKEGCTAEAINKAAANGHFEVLQLLVFKGAPATVQAFRSAIHKNRREIVEFLKANLPAKYKELKNGFKTGTDLDLWVKLRLMKMKKKQKDKELSLKTFNTI